MKYWSDGTCQGPIYVSNKTVWKLFILGINTWYHITMRIICIRYEYLIPYDSVNYLYLIGILDTIWLCELFVFDRNTWYHMTKRIICIRKGYLTPYDWKLFILDRNTWYHITIRKLFVLKMNTWYLITIWILSVLLITWSNSCLIRIIIISYWNHII